MLPMCYRSKAKNREHRDSNFKFTNYKSKKLYANSSIGVFAMGWEKIRNVYYENYIVDRTSFYKNTMDFFTER